MSNVRTYLNLLPKDLTRIIYKYIYNYVLREINNVVQHYEYKRNNAPGVNHRSLVGIVPEYATGMLLESSTCKIHNYALDVCTQGQRNSWSRSEKKYRPFYMETSCVWTKVIKSQDHEGSWNKNFKIAHRYSIINGGVYHYTRSLYSGNAKYRLVPFYESNHCWQDLAVRFMRNARGDGGENSELKLCQQKTKDHVAHKKDKDYITHSCVIC